MSRKQEIKPTKAWAFIPYGEIEISHSQLMVYDEIEANEEDHVRVVILDAAYWRRVRKMLRERHYIGCPGKRNPKRCDCGIDELLKGG